jgi:hypothetical protein
MKLKENIKIKVDQLETSQLRLVDALIDSLSRGKDPYKKMGDTKNTAFLKVIELMNPNFLSSDDIILGRRERP